MTEDANWDEFDLDEFIEQKIKEKSRAAGSAGQTGAKPPQGGDLHG